MTETKPTQAEPKAGWKTTEFWLTGIATLVSLLVASGVVVEESGFGKVVAMVVMALSAAGYSVSRGGVKKAAGKS